MIILTLSYWKLKHGIAHLLKILSRPLTYLILLEIETESLNSGGSQGLPYLILLEIETLPPLYRTFFAMILPYPIGN